MVGELNGGACEAVASTATGGDASAKAAPVEIVAKTAMETFGASTFEAFTNGACI